MYYSEYKKSETSGSQLFSSIHTSVLQHFNITGLLLHANRAVSGNGSNVGIRLIVRHVYLSDVQIFIYNSIFHYGEVALSGGGMHIAVLDSGEGNGS